MKLLSSANEIPELAKDNVRLANEGLLIEKINKLIQDGHSKLQIVTDFDHTLTRHSLDNGTTVLTSFGMFGHCPSIPQHYKDEDSRLSDFYKPIESDASMSVEEKAKHMVEWYIAANNLLKGLRFPRSELKAVATSMTECFRLGVQDIITWSASRQVPVLVFSAGLGECVTEALVAANYLLPHVKVVSNFLALDDKDNIVGINGEIIHTYNKNETALKHTEYYGMVRDRCHVLLMGDCLGDAGMAAGMDQCHTVIRVGFLGKNVEANLQNYLNQFDIVLINEHTMDVPNAILKLVP